MNPALVISAQDNVATALEPLEPGSTVRVGDLTITVTDRIPRGHKLALRAIATGEPVVKYGSPIGTASAAIAVGAHVHTHNVASTRGRGDLGARLPSDTVPGYRPAPCPTVARHQAEPRIAEPPDPDS
jgi:SAF domain-containing protein